MTALHPGVTEATIVIRVAGIDLSLTSTGLARLDQLGAGLEHAGATLARLRPRVTGTARLMELRAMVREWTQGVDLVVLEGPAFGARGPGHHEGAGLWWLVRCEMARHQLPCAVVPPAVLKMYATGSGNAEKEAMLLAAERRFPEARVTGNDVADALWLAAMGARHLGHPVDQLPQANLRAMAKADWPFPAHEIAEAAS